MHVANGAKITNSSTPVRTNRNGAETIVCNQYIGQGVETSEAIKKLDEKLDQLIKLLHPPAFPGKMHSIIASNFHDFIYESLHFLALYVILVNLAICVRKYWAEATMTTKAKKKLHVHHIFWYLFIEIHCSRIRKKRNHEYKARNFKQKYQMVHAIPVAKAS